MRTFDPEFDYVYTLTTAGEIVTTDLSAPDVQHSPGGDVLIESGMPTQWRALTGYTGQYGYSGAVMHPSEQWGEWAINALRERADGADISFSVVEVRDADGSFPDGDPIGWAVTYLEIA